MIVLWLLSKTLCWLTIKTKMEKVTSYLVWQFFSYHPSCWITEKREENTLSKALTTQIFMNSSQKRSMERWVNQKKIALKNMLFVFLWRFYVQPRKRQLTTAGQWDAGYWRGWSMRSSELYAGNVGWNISCNCHIGWNIDWPLLQSYQAIYHNRIISSKIKISTIPSKLTFNVLHWLCTQRIGFVVFFPIGATTSAFLPVGLFDMPAQIHRNCIISMMHTVVPSHSVYLA